MNQSTEELTKILSDREGVETLRVEPYEKVVITTERGEKEFSGPAVILVNID
ncbi:BC1881 family protein [Halalkalibacter oceani]|uniref:BC1881 family protein n=1 Tax=Halalkalibacter oceani TaxID=1653776 RepID=UPI00339710C2